MSLTRAQLGERIGRARERAQLSQAGLAERVGITQSAISRIESGERGVDSLELAEIAKAVAVPVADLFEADPIAEEFQLAARAAALDDVAGLQPELTRILDLARLRRLLGGNGEVESPPGIRHPFPFRSRSPVGEGKELAEHVRKLWKLDDDPLPPNLFSLLEDRSGLAFVIEPLRNRIAGLCARIGDWAMALIDSSAPFGRQRFTAAHELCHFLLRDGDSFVVDKTLWRTGRIERRANAFAAYFLMPRNSIKRYIRNREVDPEVVAELQYTFGVSLDALLWQLLNLGHITEYRRKQLLGIGAKGLAFRYGYGAEWQKLNAERGARRPPRRLHERALRAYERGEIGIEPLADLLSRRDLDVLRRDLEDQGITYDERWWKESAPA